MKRYSAYKPSGIEWIGDIPEKWDVVRIKFLCDAMYPGATPNTSVASFWDGNIPWIPSGCCHDCDINDAPKKITKAGLENSSTKIIPAETTLIALTGATCAQLGYLTIEACANQSVVAYVHNPHKAVAKYLFYALFAARQYILTHQSGGAQGGINLDDCKNFVIPRLPIDVQFSIAAYLDAKCAKIDNVLSVQQKRIELLKELKQSIITNAVTKGLDKNVKFKPSGIEWIGDIPEKWTVKKVSWLFQLGSGTTPKSGDKRYYVDDGGYNWLQTGDLNDSFILETSKKISKAAIEECNLKIYPKGSMVVAMYGATIGKTGILNIDTAVNQACCVLKKSKDVNEMFAFYMFQAGKPSLLRDANGGGQPNISQEIIAGKKFAIPPYKEQLKIVDYLNKKNYAIDNQISKIERQIELLKEYKQSIITECVTGKRKVC